MAKLHYAILVACLFWAAIAAPSALAAQNELSGWIGAGLGVGTDGVGGNLHACVAREHLSVSARYVAHANELFGNEESRDAALCIGGVTRIASFAFVSAAIGPSVVWVRRVEEGPIDYSSYRHTEITRDSGPLPGFALEGQFFFTVSRFLGLGFYAYGDLNRERSFGIVNVSVIVGKMPGE